MIQIYRGIDKERRDLSMIIFMIMIVFGIGVPDTGNYGPERIWRKSEKEVAPDLIAV